MEKEKIIKRKKVFGIVSYAKLNLVLDIVGVLIDGYHSISTLFTEINLADKLKFTLTENPEIEILSNIKSLENQDNLIYKVAIYIQAKYSVRYGAKIYLEKNIPIAAGLGGGSSNAATTIKGLSQLWELNLTREEMHDIASRFGSDINFFLEGYLAIGSNRGEVIQPIDSDLYFENILLVNPNYPISAKEAYELVETQYNASPSSTSVETQYNASPSSTSVETQYNASPSPTSVETQYNASPSSTSVETQYNASPSSTSVETQYNASQIHHLLETKDPKYCYNRLEEGICKKYPDIQKTIQFLYECGARKAMLSGSGPTMIGFFDDPIICDKTRKLLEKQNFRCIKTSTRRRQKP